MIKYFKILLSGIVASLFFFPLELNALRGINSKMVLAIAGLICLGWDSLQGRKTTMRTEYIVLFGWASLVSIISLLSITNNQTQDTTYVTYAFSFAVWLSAAYACCSCICWAHAKIDVLVVLDYLVVVCVFQCLMALSIYNVPVIQYYVDRYIFMDQTLLHAIDRWYGLGAALDVAGIRFSIVLTSMAYYLSEIHAMLPYSRKVLYIVAFLFISVIGNIIARTTLVGTALGLGFVLLVFISGRSKAGRSLRSLFPWFLIISIGIVVSVVMYNNSLAARRNLRFGFEGFFSLVENGHWRTSSTDKLTSQMIVFPDNIHTWVIGDGYFLNARYDANYLGDSTEEGFYMGTDVGYLRFLFYFGISGLISIIGVIVSSAHICIRYFKQESMLFMMALLVGLVVWFKVSTDVFLFFALFLCVIPLNERTNLLSSVKER